MQDCWPTLLAYSTIVSDVSKKLDTFRSYSRISRQTHRYSPEKCPIGGLFESTVVSRLYQFINNIFNIRLFFQHRRLRYFWRKYRSQNCRKMSSLTKNCTSHADRTWKPFKKKRSRFLRCSRFDDWGEPAKWGWGAHTLLEWYQKRHQVPSPHRDC